MKRDASRVISDEVNQLRPLGRRGVNGSNRVARLREQASERRSDRCRGTVHEYPAHHRRPGAYCSSQADSAAWTASAVWGERAVTPQPSLSRTKVAGVPVRPTPRWNASAKSAAPGDVRVPVMVSVGVRTPLTRWIGERSIQSSGSIRNGLAAVHSPHGARSGPSLSATHPVPVQRRTPAANRALLVRIAPAATPPPPHRRARCGSNRRGRVPGHHRRRRGCRHRRFRARHVPRHWRSRPQSRSSRADSPRAPANPLRCDGGGRVRSRHPPSRAAHRAPRPPSDSGGRGRTLAGGRARHGSGCRQSRDTRILRPHRSRHLASRSHSVRRANASPTACRSESARVPVAHRVAAARPRQSCHALRSRRVRARARRRSLA